MSRDHYGEDDKVSVLARIADEISELADGFAAGRSDPRVWLAGCSLLGTRSRVGAQVASSREAAEVAVKDADAVLAELGKERP